LLLLLLPVLALRRFRLRRGLGGVAVHLAVLDGAALGRLRGMGTAVLNSHSSTPLRSGSPRCCPPPRPDETTAQPPRLPGTSSSTPPWECEFSGGGFRCALITTTIPGHGLRALRSPTRTAAAGRPRPRPAAGATEPAAAGAATRSSAAAPDAAGRGAPSPTGPARAGASTPAARPRPAAGPGTAARSPTRAATGTRPRSTDAAPPPSAATRT